MNTYENRDGVTDEKKLISPYDSLKQNKTASTINYSGEADKALAGIINYKPFEYNPDTDELTKAYMKQYTREGKRATADVMGNASLLSGGLPSSNAIAVAGQTANQYAAAKADKTAELYAAAYDKYYKEYSMNIEKYNALKSTADSEYQKTLTLAEKNPQLMQALISKAKNDSSLAEYLPTSSGRYGYSAESADQIAAKYQNGSVTDYYDWQILLSVYGETNLKNAGYSYTGNTGTPYDGISGPYYNYPAAGTQTPTQSVLPAPGVTTPPETTETSTPETTPTDNAALRADYSDTYYRLQAAGADAAALNNLKTPEEWAKNNGGYSSYSDYAEDYAVSSIRNINHNTSAMSVSEWEKNKKGYSSYSDYLKDFVNWYHKYEY